VLVLIICSARDHDARPQTTATSAAVAHKRFVVAVNWLANGEGTIDARVINECPITISIANDS
jgi:hypothetical protein